MISMIIYCILCIWLFIFNPTISILLGIFFLVFKSFKFKYLFILILILFYVRLNVNLCEPIQKGKIVEINRNSVIVQHNLTNVLVSVSDVSNYALQDELFLYTLNQFEYSSHQYGFNVFNYHQSRNICYSAKEVDTFRIEGKGFFNWLSKGGNNQSSEFKQLSRILLFQSNPNEDFELFISMGLIFMSLIKLIEQCFIRVKNRNVEIVVCLFVMCFIGLNLAFPLSLIRVCIFYITTKFINDRLLRYGLNFLLCAFISPYGLTQLSFVLPLLLQFSSLFISMKSRYVQRLCVLIFVFIAYNNSFSLLNIILYPILLIIYRILLLMTLIGLFTPYLNDMYVLMLECMNNIFKFTQSLFIIKGHISILFILSFILIHHYTNRNRYQFLICLFIMIFGIPTMSLPLFYSVTLINVGQGDSILIQAPFNQCVILIDTGSPYQKNALMTYLNAQSIYKIHSIIITHDDLDHSGNLDHLKIKYEIDDVVLKGKDIAYRKLVLKFLDFDQKSNSDNDLSLIYSLDLYSKRFLFMGDLSVEGERKLIQQFPHLKADILKVGHHGSNTSTSDDFLKHIQAQIALIGVGKNNYGHPSLDVLSRLSNYYFSIFDTRTHGDIKVIALSKFFIIIDSNHQFYLF